MNKSRGLLLKQVMSRHLPGEIQERQETCEIKSVCEVSPFKMSRQKSHTQTRKVCLKWPTRLVSINDHCASI
jgi:hypothetical protein